MSPRQHWKRSRHRQGYRPPVNDRAVPDWAEAPLSARSHVNRDGTAKVSFPSLDEAKAAAGRINQHTGRQVETYLCSLKPDHWHLSTNITRSMRFLTVCSQTDDPTQYSPLIHHRFVSRPLDPETCGYQGEPDDLTYGLVCGEPRDRHIHAHGPDLFSDCTECVRQAEVLRQARDEAVKSRTRRLDQPPGALHADCQTRHRAVEPCPAKVQRETEDWYARRPGPVAVAGHLPRVQSETTTTLCIPVEVARRLVAHLAADALFDGPGSESESLMDAIVAARKEQR